MDIDYDFNEDEWPFVLSDGIYQMPGDDEIDYDFEKELTEAYEIRNGDRPLL